MIITKDWITIGIAVVGWGWAVIQFFLTRRNQKSDKILEKRLDIYSAFMNKMDEMNTQMRNDPKVVFGCDSELMEKLLSGDEEKSKLALLQFNSDLIEMTKNSTKPLMIINQELNKLKMVCSYDMLPKIEEYKKLTSDYSDEFQIVLNKLSNNTDLAIISKELGNIGYSDRNIRMTSLWKEIEKMMREEIGYYSK